MKMNSLLMLALLSFCIANLILIKAHASLSGESTTDRVLRIRVVDAAGDPLSNIRVEPRGFFDDGRPIISLAGYSDDAGIFECKVPDGTYEAFLSTQGASLIRSPQKFEVAGDTEVTVTAHLIHLLPPSPGGIFELGGIHVNQNLTDMMDVYVSIANHYGESKNVTIEVWIENNQFNRISTEVINATLLDEETRKVVPLPPPPNGWESGSYTVHGKVFGEVLYSENESLIRLNVVGVPVWMQWWFWLSIAIIVGAFGAAYVKKRKK